MIARKLRLLAASVSSLALGSGLIAPAYAADGPGVRQEDHGLVAINLHEVDASESPQVFGTTESTTEPSSLAAAVAEVTCAATCAHPGAIEQLAIGTLSAFNIIDIAGTQVIRAEAEARGARATAVGYIDLAVGQLALAAGLAENLIEISGLLNVHASADALAATGTAFAGAAVGTALWQVAAGSADSGVSTAVNAVTLGAGGELSIAAQAGAESDGGAAIAAAQVSAGVYQEAIGLDIANNLVVNAGAISVGASATAVAARTAAATASAFGLGLEQVASARSTPLATTDGEGGGTANAEVDNSGTLTVLAAYESDGGSAAVGGAAAQAIRQTASGSTANASVENSGTLAARARGHSEGEMAVGMAVALGVTQVASGMQATVEIANAGSMQVLASAESDGLLGGYANVAVYGLDQDVAAPRAAEAVITNDGLIEITGLAGGSGSNEAGGLAYVTGVAQTVAAADIGRSVDIQPDGTTYRQWSTPTGAARGRLQNSGTIEMVAAARAEGETAFASAVGLGLVQRALGTDASGNFDNSGDFSLTAVASADAEIVARASAIAVGISQVAVALDQETEQFAGVTPGVGSLRQSASPTGAAAASLVNGGTIDITALARAEAAEAATGSAFTNGWAAASAAGVVQAAAGAIATASLDNQGSISVAADADAEGVSSAVGRAAASGVVQAANAAAEEHFAGVQPGGTQTFAGSTVPAGEAIARLANSGSVQVLANALAEADTAATASALANGLGQFAIGSLASVEADNSGSIAIGAAVGATGDDFAYARARAMGVVQSADAVAQSESRVYTPTPEGGFSIASNAAVWGVGRAIAELSNSGTLSVRAQGAVSADGAAIVTAIASGVTQITAGEEASAELTNDGTITVVADAQAQANGDDAFATAVGIAANGVYQDVQALTDSAAANLTNSGDITINVLADASSDGVARAVASADFAIAQIALSLGHEAQAELLNLGSIAIGLGAIAVGGSANAQASANSILFQDAMLVGEGTAQGVIENQGSIDVDVTARAEGELLASAFAVNSGMSQNVTASEVTTGAATVEGGTEVFRVQQPLGPGSATLDNSGTIAIRAIAEADATDGYASSFAAVSGFAQAARGTDAEAVIDNEGEFRVAAVASAQGANGVANANAAGIDQTAWAMRVAQTTLYAASMPVMFENSRTPAGPALVALDNSGTLGVLANAVATGASALAGANVDGIDQYAAGTDASAVVGNSGSIAIAALVHANGEVVAEAVARAAGITQTATALATEQRVEIGATGTNVYELDALSGPASAQLVNEGDISIVAAADAGATEFAYASALVTGVVQAAIGTDAQALIDNSGELSISGLAEAAGNTAVAIAGATGFMQLASSVEIERDVFTPIPTGPTTGTVTINSHTSGSTFIPVGPASARFENSGTFDVQSLAVAEGEQVAVAGVQLWGGTQDADGTSVEAAIINSADITLAAAASAVADTIAAASAYNNGFRQYANATMLVQNVVVPQEDGGVIVYNGQSPVGPATGTIVNDGTIEITSVARAQAEGGLGTGTTLAPGTVGYGTAFASGFAQFVWGTEATGSLDNSGSLVVAAQVDASGEDGSGAVAAAQGVRQGVNTLGATIADHFAPGGEYLGAEYNLYYAGPATISVVNEGTMSVVAQAEAAATDGPASASADARGFSMGASGTRALIEVDNSGDLGVAALADASGTTGLASAIAAGMTQGFSTGLDFNIDVVNSGSIQIDARASAVQDNGATAIAAAVAVIERGTGIEESHLSLDNSGTIEVDAIALAEGGYFAGGTAFATGVGQRTISPNAELALDNSGTIDIAAGMRAVADADTGFAGATAFAHAYTGFATSLSLDITNSGTIRAVAAATGEGANGWAWSTAAGIAVAAIGGTGTAPALGTLSAAVENRGTITVAAFADGIADAVDPLASTAEAAGISLAGGAVTGTIENSGIINVSAAVASEDGTATAGGIVVLNNGQSSRDGDAVITITNDGGIIIARESSNGGDSWRRGTAIDLGEAPNTAVVNLLDEGIIYGNIDVRDDDQIFVRNGTTYFDGIINPECVRPNGTFADVGTCAGGTLTIDGGGNLILANSPLAPDGSMGDEPTYVFVDTFQMGADGTLTLQLRPDGGGAQPVLSYPQLFAEVANLDGTLVADVPVAGGLFEDSYKLNDVIDAQTRTGSFDECVMAGDYRDSALLSLNCTYDAEANVDLGLTRIAFDAVSGLTGNQGALAGGLEALYGNIGPDGLLGTGLGAAVAELFRLDATAYPLAIEQLTGAGYAGYLQSLNTLGYHYNQILSRSTDCEVPALAGSALACRVAPVHLWGQVDQATLKQEGNSELGGHEADRWSFLAGGDIRVLPAAVIGASIGKVTNKVSYDDTATRIRGDGWQLGLYGTLDPGSFFLKALGTYSNIDGDARRIVDWTGFGGTLAGVIDGDADVRMLTLGLHGGVRIPVSATSVATPFVDYDLTRAKLEGFGESGLEGANLRINGGTAKHSWLTGGVKIAGQLGGLIPEAMVGYRRMFGERRSSFNASFAGFEADSDFDIVSMAENRGSILAGLSIGGSLGRADLRAGYSGAFNDDARQHSGFLKLVLPLGGGAVPPPPSSAANLPAPAEPAAAVPHTCPDGSLVVPGDVCPTSPPPLPVVMPERG